MCVAVLRQDRVDVVTRVSQELEEASADPVSNPASAINTECVADNAVLQVCVC